MKKELKVLIVLLSLIMIAIAVGVSAYLLKGKEKNAIDKKEYTETNEIYEKFLKLSYILNGDVKTTIDPVMLGDEDTYYYVKDDIVKDIKTNEDIRLLIYETFSNELADVIYDNYVLDKYNRYISYEGSLYVLKKENPCDKYNFSKKDYEYEKTDDGYTIHGDIDLKVKYENNKLVATSLPNLCE